MRRIRRIDAEENAMDDDTEVFAATDTDNDRDNDDGDDDDDVDAAVLLERLLLLRDLAAFGGVSWSMSRVCKVKVASIIELAEFLDFFLAT